MVPDNHVGPDVAGSSREKTLGFAVVSKLFWNSALVKHMALSETTISSSPSVANSVRSSWMVESEVVDGTTITSSHFE